MTATVESLAAQVQALQDRVDITEVLCRYSSAVDQLDSAGVRSTLADDLWAQYGNGEPVEGGQKVADWIASATATILWQHHRLDVYHVDVEGDHAKTLSYLTSHQVFEENPDTAVILVARYHDELKRTSGGWKISRRIMEILWGETRKDDGFLASIGGRGPQVWKRA